jgi:hypothetical protein
MRGWFLICRVAGGRDRTCAWRGVVVVLGLLTCIATTDPALAKSETRNMNSDCSSGPYSYSIYAQSMDAIGISPDCARDEREREVVQTALDIGSWVRWGVSVRGESRRQNRIRLMAADQIERLISDRRLIEYSGLDAHIPEGYRAYSLNAPYTVATAQRIYIFSSDTSVKCEVYNWNAIDNTPAFNRPSAPVVCNFVTGSLDANIRIPSPLIEHISWLVCRVSEQGQAIALQQNF